MNTSEFLLFWFRGSEHPHTLNGYAGQITLDLYGGTKYDDNEKFKKKKIWYGRDVEHIKVYKINGLMEPRHL